MAHRHPLRFGDGTEHGFLLDGRRAGLGPMVVEPFENRRIRSAAEHVRKRVADAQAPAMPDRIGKGRKVTFGPLTADAHGVFVPGGLLGYRWADLREPRLAVNLPDFPVPSS